ncbi:MAG: phosphatase PAP2 family protein, partial [Clostridia bacterium]|nr:phosphatase PAP2 family protein [Clostridia bacterium]
DIIFLGIYYIVVIFSYLIFEMIPINYRPIFINGFAEASYPSSTTLLVLSVMPTLVFQAEIRIKKYKKIIKFITVLFSVSMVVGRLLSGVHWFTDIIGSCFLSLGLFYCYKASVLSWGKLNGI